MQPLGVATAYWRHTCVRHMIATRAFRDDNQCISGTFRRQERFQNLIYMYLAEQIRIYSVYTVYIQGLYIQG